MTEYLLGKGNIQSHEENRPVDGMETDDILTDQMEICRPVLIEKLAAIAICVITDTGDVVGQCIQPYIGNMLGIEINRNSPGEAGAGYTQILKTRLKEVIYHLVLTGYRLNEFGMFVIVLHQTVRILGHLEEVSFLGCLGYRASTVRTLAIYQLGFCPEGFARGAVPSLICSLIDIALVEELPEDLLNLLLMVLIGRTHELVIGRIHKIPDSADFTCSLIYEFLGRDASFCSLILDLLSVFIGTSHEEYIISFLTTIACNRICEYNLVGISDVRLA